VEIDAIRANFRQQMDDFDRRERLAYRFAERITPNVANRPESEGEFVFGFGFVHVTHRDAHFRSESLSDRH
jgi:hypothetical protein